MYVDPYLDEALRMHTPDDASFSLATQRAERLGNVLANDASFGCAEYEVGGSCAKHTALAPLNDVDLFLYLTPGDWSVSSGNLMTPARVLGELARRVQRTYKVGIRCTNRVLA